MKPPPFDYVRVSTVQETLDALSSVGSEAKVLAGGQSLMPLLNFRLARPQTLVDINPVKELASVSVENGHLQVGAMMRQRDLELHPQAAEAVPLLAEALGYVGHVTIRNRGTVGGSLAHADPAAELPLVAVTLGAEMVMRRGADSRTVPASEFFIGPLATALGEDEVLTHVRFPRQPAGVGSALRELARRSGDFAIVSAAAAIGLDGDRSVTSVRVGVGGVEAVPRRLEEVESTLKGGSLTDQVVEEAAEQAAANVEPIEDIHGTADYRRTITRVLTRRAIAAAAARSNGGQR